MKHHVHCVRDCKDDKDERIPADSLTTLDSSQKCKSGGALHLEHYSPFNFNKVWYAC